MAQVSIIKCRDYEQEQVDRSVQQALELIGGLARFVQPGQRVLLKVNALTIRPPEAAVTTHPAVIKAVIRAVKRVGGIPSVGDSSAGIISGQAPTSQVFLAAGIAQAAEEEGVALINFDTAGAVEVECGGPVKILNLAKPALEADVVISMPKLKTHSASLFTGAVKNMYGCVPGFRKADYHRMAPTLRQFAELLVDVFQAVRPGLAIMDAVVGMEGNGPSAGKPRQVGLIIAGQDGVAVDAAASLIIGLDPLRVATTAAAHKRGVGVGDPALIKMLGAALEEVRIPDFDLPSTALLDLVPGFLVSGALGLLRARPEINKGLCAKCSICVDSCPVEAVSLLPGQSPLIDYEKCITCLCCQELCPKKAVEMKQARILGKAAAALYNGMKKLQKVRY